VQRGDLDAAGRELVADRVGQRPFRRLRRGVRTELARVQPGEHGQHVEDRAAAVALDDRRERPRHGQRAEVVGLHLQPDLVQVAADQRGAGRRAGVVHQQRRVGGERRGRLDGLGIGDVECQHDCAGQVDGLGAAGGGVHLGTAIEQLGRDVAAEAAVGAGHDGDGVLDVHAG
jgi:hypothetical protein